MLKCCRKLHRCIAASASPWGVNGPWQGCLGEETFSPWSHTLVACKESQKCNPFLKKKKNYCIFVLQRKRKKNTWVLKCCSAPHLCGKQIIGGLCLAVKVSILASRWFRLSHFSCQRGWSWLVIVASLSGPAEAVPVHSWSSALFVWCGQGCWPWWWYWHWRRTEWRSCPSCRHSSCCLKHWAVANLSVNLILI